MVDFESDDWEEQMLAEGLDFELIFAPPKRIEESVVYIMRILEIYFANVAIREGTEAYRNLHKIFNDIQLVLKHKLEEDTPLKTTTKNRNIALFIDGLVLWGASKAQAIEATAEWLGKGTDLVEKIAKTYCRVKFESKNRIIKFERSKRGFLILAIVNLLPFIKSQRRAFSSSKKDIQEAYEKMVSEVEKIGG